MRSLGPLLALLLVLVACSTASHSVPTAGSRSGSTSVPQAPAATFDADGNGLKLIATFDRLTVQSGGTITVGLTLDNTRSTEVVFEEPCYQPMTVEIPNPVEPGGREWTGIAAAFKTYALEQGQGTPIESSTRTPLKTVARALPCHAPTRGEPSHEVAVLLAGQTYETTLTWSAELVKGLPAGPGEVPFSVRVLHDQETAAGGMIKAETLEVTGNITIVKGDVPGAISAGRALDAVLGDPDFSAWLSKQPRKSWENANLFLQPAAVGVDVLPAVPYWDIELYRAPRNWAVMYIDASSGAVLKQIYCDVPCDK